MTEKILIVDDDVDTLRLVGLMLQRQGYQIVAASNGSQGLEKAFEERPDLILLDVMMPDMDGFEVTRRLRKNPATERIPVIFLTVKGKFEEFDNLKELGALAVLTKPFDPTLLTEQITDILKANPMPEPRVKPIE